MELDYLKFGVVSVLYWGICLFFFKGILRGPEKSVAISFSAFFFLFNGFGVSDVNSPGFLVLGLIVAISIFLWSARVGSILARRIGATIVASDGALQNILKTSKGAQTIFGAFVLLNLIALTVPEFRLHLLVSLPDLDIRQWFERRLAPEQRGIISYFLVLIIPFYYLALWRYVGNWVAVLFLLLLPVYFGFVAEGYIGRYEIVFQLMIFWIYLWVRWPRVRGLLLFLTIAGFPIFLFLFNVFASVRLGVPLDDAIYFAANNFFAVLEGEVTFLQISGNRLIESGQNINLISYGTWLLTLPLPGFLKSNLPIALVNFEISEIVLGLRTSDSGFFVLLPGLLAESFFLFGGFFFCHFLFLGFLGGVVSQVTGRSRAMFFLHLFYVVSFGLVLNRGGIASLAPHVFTEPLLFSVFILAIIFFSQRKRKG